MREYGKDSQKIKSINLSNRTCIIKYQKVYIASLEEKRCIYKDGDDYGLVIVPNNNIATIGIWKNFS